MTSSRLVTATAVLFAVACAALLLLQRSGQREHGANPTAGRPADAAQLDQLREDNPRLQREENRLSDAQTELDRLREENARLRRERDRAEQAQAELAREHDRLAAEKESPASEAVGESPAEKKPERRLRVEFGEAGSPDALVTLDLSKISQASRTLSEMGVLLSGAAGKDAQMEVWKQMGGEYKRARQDLSLLGYALRGQLPTHIEGGESTHPLVTANLVSETLEDQGLPLEEAQVSQIELLGDDYERARQRLEAGYDANTLALRRIIDELELRRNFSEALDSVLDDAQLEALGPVEVRYVAHLDFQSVAVALSEVSQPLPFASPENLHTGLERLTQSWGVQEQYLPTIAFALDDWASAPTAAVPVTPSEVKFYRLDVAIAAGRAQQRAMEIMARLLAHETEVVTALRSHRRFVVPRLTPGWTGGEK